MPLPLARSSLGWEEWGTAPTVGAGPTVWQSSWCDPGSHGMLRALRNSHMPGNAAPCGELGGRSGCAVCTGVCHAAVAGMCSSFTIDRICSPLRCLETTRADGASAPVVKAPLKRRLSDGGCHRPMSYLGPKPSVYSLC